MQSVTEAIQSYLPKSLHYLSTIIGMDSMPILIKTQGGTRINMPGTARPEHWLADLIGMDDFKKLAVTCHGDELNIPRCIKLLTLTRDIDILRDSRARLSYKQMALKHGMTEAGIRKALRRIEPQELCPWLKEVQAILKANP